MNRFLADDQRIEGVAIVAEGSGDETVIGGIVDGAVQDAIQTEQTSFLVQFVLVLTPLRDLDDYGKRLLDDRIVYITVVPRVHASK